MLFPLIIYPRPFFTGIAIICLIALASAFFAELVLGLEPCILCLYQRWPFVIALGLAMMGRGGRNNAVFTTITSLALAVTFLSNSALAFYHSGVERKWWPSHLEGCTVPNLGSTPESILENILAAPTARCDEIPWADPFIGLSMANYNAAFCLGLACLCLIFLVTKK